MGTPARFLRSTAARYRNGTRALAISGTYTVVLLGVAVFSWIAGGLAGVWLVLLALPSAFLLQFAPPQGDPYLVLLTLGGLAQAWLLWIGLRGKRLS